MLSLKCYIDVVSVNKNNKPVVFLTQSKDGGCNVLCSCDSHSKFVVLLFLLKFMESDSWGMELNNLTQVCVCKVDKRKTKKKGKEEEEKLKLKAKPNIIYKAMEY